MNPRQDTIVAVSFSKVEAMPWVRPEAPTELVKLVREIRPAARVAEAATFQEAMEDRDDHVQPQIVICGSLYLVADVIGTIARKAGPADLVR